MQYMANPEVELPWLNFFLLYVCHLQVETMQEIKQHWNEIIRYVCVLRIDLLLKED